MMSRVSFELSDLSDSNTWLFMSIHASGNLDAEAGARVKLFSITHSERTHVVPREEDLRWLPTSRRALSRCGLIHRLAL